MMKRFGMFVLMIVGLISPVFADYGLSLEQVLTSYVEVALKHVSVPESYRYIEVKYPNIPKDSSLYTALQKAIYMDILPNARLKLPLDKKITQEQALSLFSKKFSINTPAQKDSLVTVEWFKDVLLEIENTELKTVISSNILTDKEQSLLNDPLFWDVYKRLHSSYLSDSGVDEKNLLHGAIKGLVDSINDPYTTFFPPVEASSFSDSLQGEYYGIGAYVEMNKPGEMVIVSPVKRSPAEQAGLMGGDRILQINDTAVDKNISLQAATALIKGPAGTSVKLKILRNEKILEISVVRAKIVLVNVESKVYEESDGNVCLVTIAMFDFGVAQEFQSTMTNLSKKKCFKYIFDVRNNPGGALNDVVDMLNYFVPNNQASVTIKTKFLTETVTAWQPSSPKISVPVRVLINQGSASASEIFAGVIKDYATGALLVGEKSFGKGSVQELLSYDDGSMFKYTTAKWHMGKSLVNIDKKGISPDVQILDKKETQEDEVLQWAIGN